MGDRERVCVCGLSTSQVVPLLWCTSWGEGIRGCQDGISGMSGMSENESRRLLKNDLNSLSPPHYFGKPLIDVAG